MPRTPPSESTTPRRAPYSGYSDPFFPFFSSEKVFVSRERLSGFPEKGAGNFRGSLGNFQGTSGLMLSSTVRELQGKSQGNFRGSQVWGLSRSSGEPDSLAATRHICFQIPRVPENTKGGVQNVLFPQGCN